MAPAFYESLRPALIDLVQSRDGGHTSGPEKLKKQVESIWAQCKGDAQFDLGTSGKHIDVARSVLELVGRELITAATDEPDFGASPEELASFQSNLQDRLDLVLTLYEVVHGEHPAIPSLEPGALLIPVFDDLVDLISMEAWETLWSYIETRGPRFTKNMPSSRGKALPLLKFLNNFYRFLPRTTAYLPFRARVHEWATSVFEISDKSSVNFRGDFPLLVRLAWEDEDVPGEGEDVEMEDAAGVDGQSEAKDGEKNEAEKEAAGVEVKAEAVEASNKAAEAATEPEVFDLYSTFWSIQPYLTHPPTLTEQLKTKATPNSPERTSFETFRAKTDFVLPHLYAAPKTEDVRIILGKRGREAADVGGPASAEVQAGTIGELPRYLPKRRLFEDQLSDVAFRRQVYIQYLIIIRFLLNFVPSAEKLQAQSKVHKNTGGVGGEGLKSNFVLSKEDESWLRETLTKVRLAVTDSGVGGRRLRATMATIIRSEDHYAKWKSAGCPSEPFAKAAMPETRIAEVGRLWRRKVQPSQPWWHMMGTDSLSAVWKKPVQNVEHFKEWNNRPTITSLDEALTQAQADLAAIADDDPAKASKTARLNELQNTLNWRGLRLAARTNLTEFKSLNEKRDLHELVTRINAQAAEAEIGGQAAQEAADRDAEAEAEAEAEPEPEPEAEPEPEPETKVEAEGGMEGVEVNGDAQPDAAKAESDELKAESEEVKAEEEPASMEGVESTAEAVSASDDKVPNGEVAEAAMSTTPSTEVKVEAAEEENATDAATPVADTMSAADTPDATTPMELA